MLVGHFASNNPSNSRVIENNLTMEADVRPATRKLVWVTRIASLSVYVCVCVFGLCTHTLYVYVLLWLFAQQQQSAWTMSHVASYALFRSSFFYPHTHSIRSVCRLELLIDAQRDNDETEAKNDIPSAQILQKCLFSHHFSELYVKN